MVPRPAYRRRAGIVALAVIGRQFGLLAWPLIGAAAVVWGFSRGVSIEVTAPSMRSFAPLSPRC